ncbi:uncharacterized protein NEMAJ01_2375, partial [Nematocida major]|uniref:uncharacterized protein n=1 Tax=Nematocida major TaxID=1912982 RepID=UPI0020081BD1
MQRNKKNIISSQSIIDSRGSPKVNKSLLELALDKHTYMPRIYDIVNLLVTKEGHETSTANINSQTPPLVAFKNEPQISIYVEHKIGNNELCIELKLVPLNTSNGTRAHLWRQYFIESIKGFNLSPANLMYVLKLLQIPQVADLLADATSVDKALDTIERYYIQACDTTAQRRPLQDDFFLIQGYKDKVDAYTRAHALRFQLKVEMLEQFTYETFVSGLGERTRLLYPVTRGMILSEYVEKLHDAELVILTKASDYQSRKQEAGPMTVATPAVKKNLKHPNVRENYCEIHQRVGHSTKECFQLKQAQAQAVANQKAREERKASAAQKRSNSSNQDETKKMNFQMFSTSLLSNSPTVLHAKVHAQDQEFLLDTGATGNFMTHDQAKALGLDLSKGQPKTFSLKSGNRIAKVTAIQLDVPITLPNDHQVVITPFFISKKITLDKPIVGLQWGLDHQMLTLNTENLRGSLNKNTGEEPQNMSEPESRADIKKANTPKKTSTKPNQKAREIPTEKPREVFRLPTYGDITKPIKNQEFNIKLTSDEPIRIKHSYSIPLEQQDAVLQEVKRLEATGIIEKAPFDAYASPAFPVAKKNTTVPRIVVDYRRLNSITENIAFPFPDVLRTLREIPIGMKCFSQIDLKQGYHQVKVADEAQKYTGFIIGNQHYIYKRMPFGLKNAPQVFQRIMQNCLGDLPFLKIFLDSLLVHSKNQEEHNEHLKLLYERLKEHNIILNPEKTHFSQTKVEYLGHIVTEKGVQADIKKVALLKQMPPPHNLKTLRSLLGQLNWFRPYVPNLSKQIEAFTNKLQGKDRSTSKRAPIEWTTEDEKTRQHIYQQIERQIVLANPNPNEGYTLFTDACNTGIGAVLTQEHKIIGIYSKKLLPAETRYTTEEQELFAVLCALRHFKAFVLGRPVKVFTDHKNLLAFRDFNTSRAERWKMELMEYDVNLHYVPGKQNLL